MWFYFTVTGPAHFFLPHLSFHMARIYVKDENATKLPFDLFVIIGMCAFLDFFCMNQIMPNVPFMVADFFPDVLSVFPGHT